MLTYRIGKILLIYFLTIQIIYVSKGLDAYGYRLLNVPIFYLGLIAALSITFPFFWHLISTRAVGQAESVMKVILVYSVYQLLILFPMTYVLRGLPVRELVEQVLGRLYFLLIPFLYYAVLPGFKSSETPIRWFSFCCVGTVFVGIVNYVTGNIGTTSTGEIRALPGLAALFASFLLLNNLRFFSRDRRTNAVYVLSSLLGLILANARTAYLGFFVLIALHLLLGRIGQRTSRFVFQGVASFVFVGLVLTQTPVFQDIFLSRFITSFDIADSTAQHRFLLWTRSWEFFLQNPLNGSMLENVYYADNQTYAPHNAVFEVLASQGIIGLGFIAFFIWKLLRIGFHNRSDSTSYIMFLQIIFFLFFAMLNVTFLNDASILAFVLPSAVLLYRDSYIQRVSSPVYLTYKGAHR